MNNVNMASQASTKKSVEDTYRINFTVRKVQEGIAPPVAGNSNNSLKISGENTCNGTAKLYVERAILDYLCS